MLSVWWRYSCVSVIVLVCLLVTQSATAAGVTERTTPGALLAAKIVTVTNSERSERGMSVVVVHPQLQSAAEAKATEMARRGVFQHTLPNGMTAWDFMREAGYQHERAGENLAVHFVNEHDVVEAWLNSPSHRDILLDADYEHIGIGIARGRWKGHSGYFIVQLFAQERPQ